MTLHLVLLSGLYAALTLLLLYLLIAGRLSWIVRGTLVVLFTLAYLGSWQLWQDLAGWPARAVVPDRFMFHSATILEPDEEKAEKGHIYLWLTALVDEEGPAQKPRAYALPYSQSLHTQVQQAEMRMRNGMMQVGERTNSTDGRFSVVGALKRPEEEQQIQLGNLPSPSLPEK